MPTTTPRRVAVTTPLVPEATTPPTPELEAPNLAMSFEFAKFVNSHTTDYIRLADYKAAILVTLLSANLLVLVQRGGEYIAQGLTAWRLGLVVAACVYALITLAVAVNTIRPRIFKNPQLGHVFWEDISAQDREAYAESFKAMRVDDLLHELGVHNHNLARTAIRKFRWLRVGFFMALTSIMASATVILWTSH